MNTNYNRPQNNQGPGPEGLIAALLIAGCSVGAVVWLGAELAALLRHRTTFHASASIVIHALGRLPKTMSGPEKAWPPEAATVLPGPVLYWLATFLVLVAAVFIAVGLFRLFRGSGDTLDRRERMGVKTNAQFAKRRDLRPLLVKTPPPDRVVLGKLGKEFVVAEARRTAKSRPGRDIRNGRGGVAPIGPSRSGKSTLAMEMIRRWGGPAIVVSVKSDLIDGTLDHRASLPGAEVLCFDPTHSTRLGSATWTPLRSATSVDGALRAASQLVKSAPSTGSIEGGDHWRKQAEILLAGMMAVSGGSNKTMADIARWITAQDMPTENHTGELAPLIKTLRASEDWEQRELGRFAEVALLGLWRKEQRSISPVYSTAANIIWPWVDSGVAASASSCEIDLEWLCSGPNTLYVVAPLIDHDRTSGVLGGLIGDLVGQINERNIQGHPVSPEILLLIDEAGNMRLDDLPVWASTLAGMGVQLVTIWQSIAQIKAKYGARSDVVLTNFLTKIWFPGMSDVEGLNYVEAISGEEHLPSTLSRYQRNDDRPSVTALPLVQRKALREMPLGKALLQHGSLPPAIITTFQPNIPRRRRWRH